MSTGIGRPNQASPLAVAARDLVQAAKRGVLCTLVPDDGYPYGSLVDIMPLPDGDLVLLLSRLAEHQRFLDADARASIVIVPHIHDEHAMAKPRVTLVGRIELVGEPSPFAADYLLRHPDARGYLSLPDFQFYRLRVERLRYIAGFGQMGWIKGEAYRTAHS